MGFETLDMVNARTFFYSLVVVLMLAFCLKSDSNLSTSNKPHQVYDLGRAEMEEIYASEKFSQKELNSFQITRDRRKEVKALAGQSMANMDWESRGPSNVGGRTRAFIFDLRDPTNNTAFAGGVTGGIWKTENFLSDPPNWVAIGDFWSNINIGSLVQDPNNTDHFYSGTGETWTSRVGMGIWKSIDGGDTWNQLASTNNSDFDNVPRLLFDNNGHLYACTKNGGLQKSNNGGNTWTKVLGIGCGSTSNIAADIELGADGNLYASLGGFSESDSIYRSDFSVHTTNTGNKNTWTSIGLPHPFNRIEIACAEDNADVIYSICSKYESGQVEAIYRSDNKGNTWNLKSLPIDSGSPGFVQSNYNLAIEVDPNRDSTIIIGAVKWWKSLDAGDTWIYSLVGHSDQHYFLFIDNSQEYSDSAVVCNDGGIFLAKEINSNPVLTRLDIKNNGYVTTQFYGGSINPINGNSQLIGGTQDNAGIILNNPGLSIGLNYYNGSSSQFLGDNYSCFIDQTNPNLQFIADKGGNMRYTRDNWNTNHTILGPGGSKINSMDYDQQSRKIYNYLSGDKYLRWNNPATGESMDTINIINGGGSTGYLTKASPNINNRIYLASSNGNIYKIENAHTGISTTATIIRSGTPLSWYSCMEIENGNEDHMLVTYRTNASDMIYESLNANSPTPTWNSVQGNLPAMRIQWAIFTPNDSDKCLLATDMGVWITEKLNGSNTIWNPCLNFPTVLTTMLKLRKSDKVIAAFTYGRGIFTSDFFKSNDECDFAFNIPINGSATANNENATPSGILVTDCPSTGSNGEDPNDVWFKFTTPNVGTPVDITIGINSSEFSRPVVQLVTDCLASSVIACGKAPNNMYPNDVLTLTGINALEPDSCYYARVWPHIDDKTGSFEIFVNASVPECPDVLQVGLNPTQDSTYRARDTIYGNADLNNPFNIIFKAGDAIIMNPEFEVKSGASFLAIIEDCVVSLKEDISKISGKIRKKFNSKNNK